MHDNPLPTSESARSSPALSLLVCVLALAAIAATAALTARSLSRLVDAQAAVTRAQMIEGIVSDVRSGLVNAETGAQGFLLTGRASYLGPYYTGLAQLLKSRDALTGSLSDDPSAAGRLDTLNNAIVAKLEVMSRLVGLKSEGRADEAMDLLLTDIPKETMDTARDALQALADGESRRSEQYRADHAREIRTTYWVLNGSIALNVVLLAALLAHMRRYSLHQHRARQAMSLRNVELSRLLGATAARSEQVRALSELIRLLQSCSSVEEAGGVLQNQLPALTHAQSGALYLFSASRNQLRQVLAWGHASMVDFLEPADCWALRLGQRYQPGPGNGVPHCRHLQSTDASSGDAGKMQCLPMVAHGDLMGLLVLGTGAGDSQETDDEHFRGMTLEQVALAIGNLQLRESLRQQSIRDALTGLYNRRFFEEAAQRELQRASSFRARGNASCLALLMIDVDEFKRFNDQHGHDIGDRVLREVGQVLQHEVRGSDVAARYGGEEFAVLITDIPVELGVERAEQIRLAIERMTVVGLGKEVGAVTISVGIAQFPRHGDSVAALFLAADKALYEAKNAGRNRVAVAA